MEFPKEVLVAGCLAAMKSNGCGVMLGNEQVLCDDERLPEDVRDAKCACRIDFTAGLTAVIEAMNSGESRLSLPHDDRKSMNP